MLPRNLLATIVAVSVVSHVILVLLTIPFELMARARADLSGQIPRERHDRLLRGQPLYVSIPSSLPENVLTKPPYASHDGFRDITSTHQNMKSSSLLERLEPSDLRLRTLIFGSYLWRRALCVSLLRAPHRLKLTDIHCTVSARLAHPHLKNGGEVCMPAKPSTCCTEK